MKVTVKVEGLRELDAALAAIGKAAARRTLVRVLTKAGEPIARRARELAPDDPRTGSPDLHTSIAVSAKLKNPVGNREFAAVMKAGGTKGEAVAALRGARRAAAGEGGFATMHVGPDYRQFHAQFQEFGTAHHGPQPFMRPAFDEKKGEALDIIKATLGEEIMKTAKRQAARKARLAAKG